jgi:hypothetical protein
MSLNYLEEYKKLYSKYIELAVNLHNYHRVFITRTGLDTGMRLRRQIRDMRKIEKTMIEVSRKAYAQVRETRKEMIAARKIVLAEKARLRKLQKEEKQNVGNNRTD